jgi:hypothetical protein
MVLSDHIAYINTAALALHNHGNRKCRHQLSAGSPLHTRIYMNYK